MHDKIIIISIGSIKPHMNCESARGSDMVITLSDLHITIYDGKTPKVSFILVVVFVKWSKCSAFHNFLCIPQADTHLPLCTVVCVYKSPLKWFSITLRQPVTVSCSYAYIFSSGTKSWTRQNGLASGTFTSDTAMYAHYFKWPAQQESKTIETNK